MIEQIASRLKLLRFAFDMTAEEVAHQINYSANQIWQIERGASKPNIEYIAKICKIYGVSIDFLVYSPSEDFRKLINEIYSKTA